MKLASVNPELEADHFNMDNLLTKDVSRVASNYYHLVSFSRIVVEYENRIAIIIDSVGPIL